MTRQSNGRVVKRRRRGAGWTCSIRLLETRDGVQRQLDVSAESRVKSTDGDSGTVALAARKLCQRAQRSQAAALLGSLAHNHRLAIMHRLLQGPTTYRQLQRCTGLKAGPLYHHINALRLAGLIGPKNRDQYELSDAGRRLAVLSVVLPKLVRARAVPRR